MRHACFLPCLLVIPYSFASPANNKRKEPESPVIHTMPSIHTYIRSSIRQSVIRSGFLDRFSCSQTGNSSDKAKQSKVEYDGTGINEREITTKERKLCRVTVNSFWTAAAAATTTENAPTNPPNLPFLPQTNKQTTGKEKTGKQHHFTGCYSTSHPEQHQAALDSDSAPFSPYPPHPIRPFLSL